MADYLAPATIGGIGYLAPLAVPAYADTTAPTLTGASAVSTGQTTANGAVTTNEAGGLLYFIATAGATATAAAVKAGASQAVASAGAQAVAFTGLPAGAVLYPHYLHRDAAGNDSAVLDGTSFTTAAPADTTAPVLTAPTAATSGANAATGSITTDEGNGTLFFMASTNATEAAATVKTGASQAITSAGVKNVSAASLPASTLQYLHFLHRDAAGNDSLVVNSAAFTTAAPADTVGPVMQGSISATKTATTIDATWPAATDASGVAEYFYSKNSGAPVSVGLARTASLMGLTPLTPYQLEITARDTLGNLSSIPLSTVVVTDAASTEPPLVQKNIVVTLNKQGFIGTRPNIAGINWTWSDSRGEITSFGTGLTTDATGKVTVPIRTRLLSDGIGKISLDNYNGGNILTYFSTSAWVRVP